jgi:hypothetical protein
LIGFALRTESGLIYDAIMALTTWWNSSSTTLDLPRYVLVSELSSQILINTNLARQFHRNFDRNQPAHSINIPHLIKEVDTAIRLA